VNPTRGPAVAFSGSCVTDVIAFPIPWHSGRALDRGYGGHHKWSLGAVSQIYGLTTSFRLETRSVVASVLFDLPGNAVGRADRVMAGWKSC